MADTEGTQNEHKVDVFSLRTNFEPLMYPLKNVITCSTYNMADTGTQNQIYLQLNFHPHNTQSPSS